jgi:hypothetical protein
VVREGWSVGEHRQREASGRAAGVDRLPAHHSEVAGGERWPSGGLGKASRVESPSSGTMSRADDELKHMLRRAGCPVAVEGLFESRERRAARLGTKRHFRGRPRMGDLGPLPGECGNHSSGSSGQ